MRPSSAKYPPGGAFVALVPDLPQVLFEVVRDGQGPIQLQRLLQALLFVAVRVQVFGVLQQQPTRAFEDATLGVALGLVVQFATQGAEFVVVAKAGAAVGDFELAGGDGVVLVDDGDDAHVEERHESVS